MNELGVSIIWLAAQVTILCIVVLLIDAVFRRRRRSAPSATTVALVLVIALTAAVFSPWPRWEWNTSNTTTPSVVATNTETKIFAGSNNSPASSDTSPLEIEEDSTVAAAFTGFVQGLKTELVSPSVPRAEANLRWTGWLAIAVLTITAIGAIRLLIGWWSVRTSIARSTGIDDAEFLKTWRQLQREMNCSRRIEFYEASDLASAATIGWWKPVILLPAEWRDWTESERRMVLAHELAHVASGDAISWLIAQLGLLLHFYHPLVHLLVNRLRLEQELAADARAAHVTGGPQSYLLTLAELAVRQPECSVAWPARAFLPTRGTLLRRIEMLRDTRTSGDGSPGRLRYSVIALTVVTAFVVAGIRRPGMEDVVAAEPVATASPIVQTTAINLEYVPNEAVMVVAVRPANLAGRKELQPIAKFIEESMPVEETGISLKDIEQFLVTANPRKADPTVRRGRSNAPSLDRPIIELRTSKDADFTAMIAQQIGTPTEQTVDGVTLIANGKYSDTPTANAAWMPNKRTLLQGPGNELLKIAKAQKGTGPEWVSEMAEMKDIDFGIAFNVQWGRPVMQEMFNREPNPMLGMFVPLWQNADTVIGTATIQDNLTVNVHGWGKNAAAAANLKQTLSSLIPVAQGLLGGATASAQQVSPEMRDTVEKGIAVANDALSGAQVSSDGNQTTLTLTGDGVGVATLAGMLLPAVQSAREAARRTQSMNNVKQIMLALHNYHSANKRFPPPVLVGPDGETKYSWRVAILPYIDQNELYEAYARSEPWDGPNNRKLLARIPRVFLNPNDAEDSTSASYYAMVGEQTAFGNKAEGSRIRDFLDGTSNTLMVFEAKRGVAWTKPEDIPYSDDEQIEKLGGFHPGGYIGGLADGSVRFISENVDEELLRNLIKRDDRNAVRF